MVRFVADVNGHIPLSRRPPCPDWQVGEVAPAPRLDVRGIMVGDGGKSKIMADGASGGAVSSRAAVVVKGLALSAPVNRIMKGPLARSESAVSKRSGRCPWVSGHTQWEAGRVKKTLTGRPVRPRPSAKISDQFRTGVSHKNTAISQCLVFGTKLLIYAQATILSFLSKFAKTIWFHSYFLVTKAEEVVDARDL
jgi:hypothetical protein